MRKHGWLEWDIFKFDSIVQKHEWIQLIIVNIVSSNKEDMENPKLKQEKSSFLSKSISAFDEIDSSQWLANLGEVLIADKPKNDRVKAVQIIILFVFVSSLMVICWKLAYMNNPHVNGFDYVLVRTISMMIFALCNMWYLKVDIFDIKPEYRLMMLARWLVGVIGMPSFFMSIKYIPASKSALITNMNPLFVAVLAYFFLKEKITGTIVIALVGSIIGVILFSMHTNQESSAENNYFIGIILASMAWMSLSLIAILIRKMNMGLHYTLSPFYFGATTGFVALMLLIFYPNIYHFSSYTKFDVAMFLMSGCFNYIAQTSKSLALKYENASFIAPFGYLQVVALLVWDLLLFGYTFTVTDYIGVVLTSVCILLPVFYNLYKNQSQALLK